MTVIKVCGVTTFDDALAAAEAGADLLGLNFYAPSPRYLEPDTAATLAGLLRDWLGEDCPRLAGVFVNHSTEEIEAIAVQVRLDLAQLSGDEPPEVLAALSMPTIRAIRPRTRDEALRQAEACLLHAPADDALPALILDAYHPALYGGTGEQASTDIAQAIRALTPRLMLAGGLTAGNVAERLAAIAPWGVDVASGVEGAQKGRKDPARLQAFAAAVRTHDSAIAAASPSSTQPSSGATL
jgi:phosphoribosylanthranilate isomerase